MRLMALDPGPTESAYVITDETLKPLAFDKIKNEDLLHRSLNFTADELVIEMIANYGSGMPAGATVFETCIWIGRFWQRYWYNTGRDPVMIKRKTVAAHICGDARAGDGNIRQALIDRFAPNTRNHGKGVKNEPGWFYGFFADVWSAHALAVYWMDTHQ